jgi:hypothetical protein
MILYRKKREDFIEIQSIECTYFPDENTHWKGEFDLEKQRILLK